jgi:hypothetical protein
MHSMRGGPLNRAALERHRGAGYQKIFDRFRDFVTAMSEQAMITHAHAEATGDPVKQHRGNYCGPTPEPQSCESGKVKDAQENTLIPIDVPFSGHYFRTRLVRQTVLPSVVNGPGILPVKSRAR